MHRWFAVGTLMVTLSIGAGLIARQRGASQPATVEMKPGRPAGAPEWDEAALNGRAPVPGPGERLAAVAASCPEGAEGHEATGVATENLETLAILSPAHLESSNLAGIELLSGVVCGPRHSLGWMEATDAALQRGGQGRAQEIMWFWVRPQRPGRRLITVQYSSVGRGGEAVTMRHREAVLARRIPPGGGQFCLAALVDLPTAGEAYWFSVSAAGPVVFHRLILDRVGG